MTRSSRRAGWRWPTGMLAALAAVCLTLAVAPRALADPTECSGDMSGQITGGLHVDIDETCRLAPGTVVQGPTSINGELDASQATFNGDVTSDPVEGMGAATIVGSTVNGKVDLESATDGIALTGDTFTGTVGLYLNGSDVAISGNTFKSTLSCADNDIVPHAASPNTIAAGAATGQCAPLGPAATAPAPTKPAPTPTKPVPTPVPRVDVPSLIRAPAFVGGRLVVQWSCSADPSHACAGVARIAISAAGHVLRLADRRIALDRGKATKWTLSLNGLWRRRLTQTSGRVSIVVDGHALYRGALAKR